MNLIQRVKDILLAPKQTWPVIEAEPADTVSLYKNYLMILAAVPAVAGFIGMSLFGFSMMGVTIRTPFLSGLAHMVTSYVLMLVMAFVMSLIVDTLAPSFGGQKNSLAALKLVVFGGTAGMLGGIFSLIPALSMLGFIASLYSIYLIYLGLPVLMKCPQEKAVLYTVVILLCALVAGMIVGSISSLFTPTTYPMMSGRPG